MAEYIGGLKVCTCPNPAWSLYAPDYNDYKPGDYVFVTTAAWLNSETMQVEWHPIGSQFMRLSATPVDESKFWPDVFRDRFGVWENVTAEFKCRGCL